MSNVYGGEGKMSWENIEQVCNSEINSAETYVESHVAPDRKNRWERYYGKEYGNEVDGRSKYISHDCMDVVESVIPYLVRTFMAGDSKIEIKIAGQNPMIGKMIEQKIFDDLSDSDENSLFISHYQWFKDALVSNNGFIKVFYEKEYDTEKQKVPQLPYEAYRQLESNPDFDISSEEFDEEGNAINVTIKKKVLSKDRLAVDSVPHWEFLIDPLARTMNDEHGKGQKTRVTLDYLKRIDRKYSMDGEKFFKNLEDVASNTARLSDNQEEMSYMDDGMSSDRDTPVNLKGEVDLVEWYTRLDIDGDGYLENCIAWIANGVLIRYEINKDDFVPFASLSGILDPYKFFGIAFSDLVIEIQNLKTMIWRRLLDNFALNNLGLWFVRPNEEVDLDRLSEAMPGDVIMGDPEAVQNKAPQPVHPGNFSLLNQIDQMRDERTGISKTNMGAIPQASIGRTATGMQIHQNAAHQRMELIAKIFAETGIKDFYRKATILLQKNLEQPFTVNFRGKEVTISPEQIQGKVSCKVNMGIEAQVGVEEAGKIERMFGFLLQARQLHPEIISMESIHNMVTRYVSSLGFRQTSDFVTELEQMTQQAQQRMQQQQQMQQQQIKAQQDAVKTEQQLDAAKIKQKGEMEDVRIRQKEADSQRDHQVKVAELAIKARGGRGD